MINPSASGKKLIEIIIGILIPIILMLTSVRLSLTNTFVQLEYRTPNFPVDSYGMTQSERARYAPIALEYLLNDEDISFLANQSFDDGSAQYNQRELGHMQDVKELTQIALLVWKSLLLILLLFTLWAWRAGWLDDFARMLGKGGRNTVFVLAAVLLFALLSFNALFTGFHRIFFEGNTWLFLFSDTLIRLFPIRFWRDVIVLIAALTLLGGALLWRRYGRTKK